VKKPDPAFARWLVRLKRNAPAAASGALPDIDRAGLAGVVRAKRWKALNDRDVKLIVDLLEGKIKNPRHRPPTGGAASKRVGLVTSCVGFQRMYPDWSRSEIIGRVSDGYGVSETYVAKAWRKCEPWRLEAITDQVDATLELLAARMAESEKN